MALSLGYVWRKGHTLVDLRLSLPKEWTQEKARLDKAGVPTAHRGYRTRHPLALEMLATNGAALPHGGIAGDDERGRPYWFRRRLAALGERDMRAVPSNTLGRDLESPLPPSSGLGRRPPSGPGNAWRYGAQALLRRPGSGSTCAMVPKGHSWSRWSNDVGCREPIGASKAMRHGWW